VTTLAHYYDLWAGLSTFGHFLTHMGTFQNIRALWHIIAPLSIFQPS